MKTKKKKELLNQIKTVVNNYLANGSDTALDEIVDLISTWDGDKVCKIE